MSEAKQYVAAMKSSTEARKAIKRATDREEARLNARIHELEAQLAASQADVVALREALLEARPYVPEHHGPVMHKIIDALGEG